MSVDFLSSNFSVHCQNIVQTTIVLWLGCRLAKPGDVVEYPLSQVERERLQDGRLAGVGLLVGRNHDRGDAHKLPPEALDLCELEPLRQEEPDSNR